MPKPKPREHKSLPGEVVFQFVKGVSGGPLPDADSATRETIQKERIRRQRAAHIRPSTKGKGK